MKMECKEAERWISLKLDRESLPAPAARLVEEHLEVCGPCRELMKIEERRAALLSSALTPSQAEQDELAAAVLERSRLDIEVFPAARRARGWKWLAAAAALLVAAGSWTFFQGTHDPNGKEERVAEGRQLPVRVFVEEDRLDLDPFPVSPDSNWGRGIYTRRQLVSDSPGGQPGEGPSAKDPRLILDVERVETRYIQLTDYH